MDSEYKLELERCPFCGEEAVVECGEEGEYMANCPECGATLPVCATMQEAADLWNSRFDVPVRAVFSLPEIAEIRRRFAARAPRAYELTEIERSIIGQCDSVLGKGVRDE